MNRQDFVILKFERYQALFYTLKKPKNFHAIVMKKLITHRRVKMRKGLLLMFAAVFVFVAGCSTTQEVKPEPVEPVAVVAEEPSVRGDSDNDTNLKTVYFGFDKSNLTDDALKTLKENVAYLTSNPKLKVVLEGHTDNRGTTEYNLSLGQRRADKVKKYYIKLGIAENRITTTSYGREKPVDADNNESAWAKNRRAETKTLMQ
jgi:peptidoglycan-associated lipoprotein